MSGWIKLHRSLLKWEWYDDANATRLLIHLLISVNYEQKQWHGITVEPGTIVTSFEKLSEATGLTVKQVRLSMKKLESSGEVARKRADKGQAISLVKWEKLQSDEEKRASKRADRGQTEGKKRATTKEGKEGKEGKEDTNVSKEIKNVYRAFAHLEISEDDFLKLQNEGFSKSEIDDVLNRIENYKKNVNYKSLYLTSLTWLKSDRKKTQQNGTGKKSVDEAVREFLGG